LRKWLNANALRQSSAATFFRFWQLDKSLPDGVLRDLVFCDLSGGRSKIPKTSQTRQLEIREHRRALPTKAARLQSAIAKMMIARITSAAADP
jgi:hypothetical protein